MSGSNKLPSADYRLKNLTNALYLTNTDDVAIRTGIQGNINVAGNINVPGNVQVYSSPEDPVHVHITELGTYGNLKLFVPVQGTVSVNNFPSSTTITSGNIAISIGGSVVSNSNPFAVNVVGNIAGITTLPAINIASIPEVEIKNDSGNPISISKNTTTNSASNRIYVSQETDLVLADSNYPMNVARGLVTGQYVETKNGYVTGLSQNTEATLWGEATAYPWSSWTTAQKLYVISDSASDTGQSLYIDGLDGNFNKITETVTTNGLTAVATSQNFLRINHCYLIAGNTNVGKITQRLTSGTGTIVGSMAIGFGRNKGGFFTVPLGYTAYIMYGSATQFRSGAGNIGGVVKMYTRTPATPVGPFLLQYIAEVVNGQFRDEFSVPLAIPQKTDIDVRLVADGNGTQGTCAWQMILIPN